MSITRFTVTLNGTDRNPWHALGLTQNPFPQVAKAEYSQWSQHLQALGGDPIPNTDYIRRHLQGWSSEFIELLCLRFRKGEIVKFDVLFPEENR